MYVTTAALVTDMAVHFKKGRESSLIWVTQLSNAKPVGGAKVSVVNISGKELAKGTTDGDGVLRLGAVDDPCVLSSGEDEAESYSYGTCEVFAFAQKGDDVSFSSSSWSKGIETYRFNVGMEYLSHQWGPIVSHTVLDRMAAQPGEAIQMKHVLREHRETGFAMMHDDQGRTFFRLVIRLRSKVNPTIRPRKHSEWFFTEKEAWNQERKLVQSVDRDIAKSEQEGCSWGYAVDKWEQALLDGRGVGRQITIATVENYIHGLRTHTKDWWKIAANQISRADIRNLYIRLDQDGHSRSMQQKMRSALNGIFTWAIDTRLVRGIYQSPAQGVSLIGRKEDSVPEILTANEIRKLLKCAMELNHSWYAIWAVAVFTGMRQGELHALEWNDIDFENKLIYVHKSYDTKTRKVNPTTKGGWWRHVDMSSELETLLIELRATSNGRNWVLPRFKEWDKGYQAKILRTFCQGIGIPSVKFHTLRACFATLLMQDGVAPAIVMAMGGWKDQETMAIYIRHAGIDIKGATAGLKLLPTKEVMGRVVEMFKPK